MTLDIPVLFLSTIVSYAISSQIFIWVLLDKIETPPRKWNMDWGDE